MKKYEKIIGMIALACLMLALCFGAYGYLSGGIEAEKIPKEHIKNVTQTVKAKKTLRLDSDVNDVTIETYKGKDIKVIYPKSKKNPITITEDDATLQIKDSGNWTKPRTSVHFLTLDLLKDIHKGLESVLRVVTASLFWFQKAINLTTLTYICLQVVWIYRIFRLKRQLLPYQLGNCNLIK
ncbi:hypothetical protein ABG752_10385 [Streptococcus iniae]